MTLTEEGWEEAGKEDQVAVRGGGEEGRGAAVGGGWVEAGKGAEVAGLVVAAKEEPCNNTLLLIRPGTGVGCRWSTTNNNKNMNIISTNNNKNAKKHIPVCYS